MRFLSRPSRKKPYMTWDIRVTTPDGTLLDITTEDLAAVWASGSRSCDGFVELLKMPQFHLWARPSGHVEPDRGQLLDGTAALPDGMRRYR